MPSCANDWLLQKTLRDSWKFDGYVTSDCGAIGNECEAEPKGANEPYESCEQTNTQPAQPSAIYKHRPCSYQWHLFVICRTLDFDAAKLALIDALTGSCRTLDFDAAKLALIDALTGSCRTYDARL